MDSLLWATGSMLLVLLIVQFLPLGLTKKGKAVAVLAAFLLAMVGLVASSSYSLWQIVVILFVLISLTTYLLNSRLRSFLYVIDDSFGKKLMDKEKQFLDYNKINKSEGYEPFYLSRKEVASAIEQVEDKETIDAGSFYTLHETKQEQAKKEEQSDIMDEDISFLHNRSIQIYDKKVDEVTLTIPEFEDLSDIESLLLEAEGERPKTVVKVPHILGDGDELPIMTFDKVPLEFTNLVETINPLDELEELPILSVQDEDHEK